MTKIISADDPRAIELAVQALADGLLVIFPTDTVYAIGARLSDDAIMRLYLAKERPPDKAIPILLASADDLEKVAQPLTPQARRLVEKYWPGPLTLVVPKRDGLPQRVSALPTVGVRIPANKIARAIIQAAGGVLAVSSANISGNAPIRTAQEALAQMGEAVAVIVDGGLCDQELASTVAALEGRTIQVVREGPISEAELQITLDEDQ